MAKYHALGLMSGSSLDGLDIAYLSLDYEPNGDYLRHWAILEAETLPFSELWQRRLRNLPLTDALTFARTQVYFGRYMAELVQTFRAKWGIGQVDYIASHGHTIFHEPERHFTVQLGDGAALAALTGCPVISDFRGQDIALSGEGAPLAPLADHYLLPGYEGYLNLGGISNLSLALAEGHKGADLAPCNQALNALVEPLGLAYDKDGEIAAQGQVSEALLGAILELPYWARPWPKSLGNQWISQEVLPLLRAAEPSVADKLATVQALNGWALHQALQQYAPRGGRILCTGGGAFNRSLVQTLADYIEPLGWSLHLPAPTLIAFKEAALMALLGMLRLEGKANSWCRITGAKSDTINGALHLPPPKNS